MQSLSYITLDLQDVNASVVVSAKQNDRLSRSITAQLRDGGVAWAPGSGVAAAIRYRKPDGTAGFYDALENGDVAYELNGSVFNFTLAEQMLTTPGEIPVEINFYSPAGEKLTTFIFWLRVQASVLSDAEIISGDYYNVLTDQVAQAVAAASEAAEIFANLPKPSDAAPQPLGPAAPGSSALYSRGDHVHPMPSASDVGAVSTEDVRYKIYSDVAELGLTNATISDVFSAMSANSIFIGSSNQFASGQTPGNGTVEIVKAVDNSRAYIHFYGYDANHGDYRQFLTGSSPFVPTGVWVAQDYSFVKEGVTVFRKGRLRIVHLDSPSAWCATLYAEDTPSNDARVLSKVYNGSDYVDCNISVGTDSTVKVLSLWGSEIAGAQYSFLLNRYVTYFV